MKKVLFLLSVIGLLALGCNSSQQTGNTANPSQNQPIANQTQLQNADNPDIQPCGVAKKDQSSSLMLYKTCDSEASMVPTLQSNQLATFDPNFISMKRGDMVIYQIPNTPLKNHYSIERVIALPGERIQIRDYKVLIFNKDNPAGFTLGESYLKTPDSTFAVETVYENVTLKDGEYYVMGDNRDISGDSRKFGPATKTSILGKVVQ